jgi:hypothetical protein
MLSGRFIKWGEGGGGYENCSPHEIENETFNVLETGSCNREHDGGECPIFCVSDPPGR